MAQLWHNSILKNHASAVPFHLLNKEKSEVLARGEIIIADDPVNRGLVPFGVEAEAHLEAVPEIIPHLDGLRVGEGGEEIVSDSCPGRHALRTSCLEILHNCRNLVMKKADTGVPRFLRRRQRFPQGIPYRL